MIQPIMHDPLFLAQKSAPATPEDAPVARDRGQRALAATLEPLGRAQPARRGGEARGRSGATGLW